MWIKKTYITGDVIEVEKFHTRRYPKGEKREPKKKPTREQMKLANERNQIKRLRRIINANFLPGDLHTVLTYKKDERPAPEEAKEVLKIFLKEMRKYYQRKKQVFKYIVTTEYKNKAIHHHIIINLLEGENTTTVINRIWNRGRSKFSPLYEDGNYSKLAEYFVKEVKDPEDGSKKQTYSRSRNLIIPEPIVKIIGSRSWQKEPKPKKGYYIESVTSGISQVTGYPYQYYTMVKIKRRI